MAWAATGADGSGEGDRASAEEWRLRALSPLDGRYGALVEPYAAFFSEGALIRQRFAVEVAWLEHLAALPDVAELELSAEDEVALNAWVGGFSQRDALAVKGIERRTNHDVKAIEYFLKSRLTRELGWSPARVEFVHFGATSEDVTNLAYAQMVRGALGGLWLPAAEGLVARVRDMALAQAELPMLSHTHGQPATPTTLGKELAVFVARWERQLEAVRRVEILGKWGGAAGTLAADVVSYPGLDWLAIARGFVESRGFVWAPLTTQVEAHDWMAELFDAMGRFGVVLVDFCRDMWSYISLRYLRQKAVEGEVGSSTMPHKINPIDFENAEANASVAGALFRHLSEKLPLSRLQRDLSDSSALRNIGSAFGYSALAIASARRGLQHVEPDPGALAADLDSNWEVLAEALQTVMRRYGIPEPYERLKAATRGKNLSPRDFRALVAGLGLPETVKSEFMALDPAKYTGLAAELAKLIDGEW
ncbi:MAG TPA: adenylosuccinate lyase [Acidimicrobiales bacterium]|nr:adenylosuccinate lyase [Acidimicrobiales bacterium]